jgi:hypothetical protein
MMMMMMMLAKVIIIIIIILIMSSCVSCTQQFSFSQYCFVFFQVFQCSSSWIVIRKWLWYLICIYGCISFTLFISVILNFGNTIPLQFLSEILTPLLSDSTCPAADLSLMLHCSFYYEYKVSDYNGLTGVPFTSPMGEASDWLLTPFQFWGDCSLRWLSRVLEINHNFWFWLLIIVRILNFCAEFVSVS